jgi:hypothetical protein
VVPLRLRVGYASSALAVAVAVIGRPAGSRR